MIQSLMAVLALAATVFAHSAKAVEGHSPTLVAGDLRVLSAEGSLENWSALAQDQINLALVQDAASKVPTHYRMTVQENGELRSYTFRISSQKGDQFVAVEDAGLRCLPSASKNRDDVTWYREDQVRCIPQIHKVLIVNMDSKAQTWEVTLEEMNAQDQILLGTVRMNGGFEAMFNIQEN